MPTTTAPDLYEEAYELGYRGRPMTERLKRAGETDHAIFETWRSGRADRGADDERQPKTAPNNSSTSSVPTSSTSTSSGEPLEPGAAARALRDRRRARRKAKTPLRRRQSTGGRAYRSVAGVVRPTTSELGHLLVLGLLLVVLYLVLTNVGTLTGALGLVQRSIGWLVAAK